MVIQGLSLGRFQKKNDVYKPFSFENCPASTVKPHRFSFVPDKQVLYQKLQNVGILLYTLKSEF